MWSSPPQLMAPESMSRLSAGRVLHAKSATTVVCYTTCSIFAWYDLQSFSVMHYTVWAPDRITVDNFTWITVNFLYVGNNHPCLNSLISCHRTQQKLWSSIMVTCPTCSSFWIVYYKLCIPATEVCLLEKSCDRCDEHSSRSPCTIFLTPPAVQLMPLPCRLRRSICLPVRSMLCRVIAQCKASLLNRASACLICKTRGPPSGFPSACELSWSRSRCRLRDSVTARP